MSLPHGDGLNILPQAGCLQHWLSTSALEGDKQKVRELMANGPEGKKAQGQQQSKQEGSGAG
jgi:hypothetical protein